MVCKTNRYCKLVLKMRKKIIIELLLVVCFTLLITSPFINQAFHIDDEGYLSLAKSMINRSYFEVYKQKFKLSGIESNYMKSGHPLLIPLYLKCIFLLTHSFKEWILHLFFIIFPLLASISMYFIGKRFTKYPLWTALLLITTPAFMVMSHNIMTDIPALSFFLGSMAAYIYGVDKNNIKLIIFSGIMATLAVFTSYLMFYIIPFMILYSLLNKKNLIRSIPALLIPVFVFIIFSVLDFFYYGKPQILMGVQDVYTGTEYNIFKIIYNNICNNSVSNLVYIGGTTLFPLVLILGFFKKKYLGIYLILLVFSINLLSIIKVNYNIFDQLFFLLFVFTGLLVLFKLIENVIKNISMDNIFLFIWFIGILLINIIIYPFNAVRYILPLIPPFIVVFINQIEKRFKKRYIHKFFITAAILTLFISIGISFADYEYAGNYKEFAMKLSNKYSGKNVWFTGEWGFRYYMEKNGYKYLLINDNRPQKGDIVIIPEIPCPVVLTSFKKRMKLIYTVTTEGKIPIRTMSFKANAGFYSSGFGLLPYTFSNIKIEHFNIYKVK